MMSLLSSFKFMSLCFLLFFNQQLHAKEEIKIVKECHTGGKGCSHRNIQFSRNSALLNKANGTKIGVLNGEFVKLLNSETWYDSSDDSRTWYEVLTENGKKGWVAQYKTDGSSGINEAEALSEDDLAKVKEDQAEKRKLKVLTEAQMLKEIEKNSFDLTAQYKIKKVFNENFGAFSQGMMMLADKPGLPQRLFYFKNCEALIDIFKKGLKFKSIGSPPWQINSHQILTLKSGQPVTDGFLERCQDLVDYNTPKCPTTNNFYEYVESKVGPLVSFEKGSMESGGCGPVYTNVYFETHDLKTRKPAVITDYFDEAEIVAALKKDAYVTTHFSKSKSPDVKLKDYIEELDLQGFAIFEPKIYNGKLRIRWSSRPSGCGMCMNSYVLIGMDLTPKPEFMAEFKKLDPKNELFLYQKLKDLSLAEELP